MTDKPKKGPGRNKGKTRKPLTVMLDIEKIESVGGDVKARKVIQNQFEKL
jgi:hypothetical protein